MIAERRNPEQHNVHPERAFRLINLLDIKEAKRKFWPQQAVVIVRCQTREIVDVMQYFSDTTVEPQPDHLQYYPDCRAIFVRAGSLSSVAELEAHAERCCESIGDEAYIVGNLGSAP